MKWNIEITKQDGRVVSTNNVTITGCTIKCISEHKKTIECGTYENVKRAAEVFNDLVSKGWEDKAYVMPQN